MFDEKYYTDVYQDKTNEELLDLYQADLTDEARSALNKIFGERAIESPSKEEKDVDFKNHIKSLSLELINRPRTILYGIFLLILPGLVGLSFSVLNNSSMAFFYIICLSILLLISYGIYEGRSWGIFWAYKFPLFLSLFIVTIDFITAISGVYGSSNSRLILMYGLKWAAVLMYVLLLKLFFYYKSSKLWFQNCAYYRRLINAGSKSLRL